MDKLKKDIILISGILLTAALLWLIPLFMNKETPAVVKVIQDGQVIGIYPLSEDRTEFISYGEENYNLLFISNGEASVSDADCPDGLCIRSRNISRNGENIICLPHKLVIQIESKEESELDTVTY